MAKFSAALNILNCPDIFCLTLTFRMALSEPLLSGGPAPSGARGGMYQTYIQYFTFCFELNSLTILLYLTSWVDGYGTLG